MLYMQLHSKELTAARLYRSLWRPNFIYSALKQPLLHSLYRCYQYFIILTPPLLQYCIIVHSLYRCCPKLCYIHSTVPALQRELHSLLRRCQSCMYCTRCTRGRQNIISLTLHVLPEHYFTHITEADLYEIHFPEVATRATQPFLDRSCQNKITYSS